MTNERYKEIRKDPQFLYKYFLESGGARINEREFSPLLAFWLQTWGEHPQTGMQKIVNYLDKKFAETK